VSLNRYAALFSPSLQWIPLSAVLHLHRYYGIIRLLHTPSGLVLRSPSVQPYRFIERRAGGLPGSWGIHVKACPGLGTPVARQQPRFAVVPILPSASETASASTTVCDFGAESSRPAFSLSTLHPTGHPMKCKTRYRPARYGFDRAGLSPARLRREVSPAHVRFPLPQALPGAIRRALIGAAPFCESAQKQPRRGGRSRCRWKLLALCYPSQSR
jgi:hypothetical protein